MPTRLDVDLARAAIDRGFLTIQESVKCLEIQREYEKQGIQVPLQNIFLKQELLTRNQLGVLKEALARSEALRRVGHYDILAKVGAGGMGTVYKAKDRRSGRIVALKVLSPGHASKAEYVRSFLREAHASGRLSHPNVVQGYDAGEANGQHYFVMEFVEGTTVAEMLRDGRSIAEQQALDVAIQIAKALEHAEQNHLIHSDIKPDNIMITHQGVAKLADLGLARIMSGDRPASGQRSFGTAYYASPEQCRGGEELDTKSDMYSFGATLFHMLCGRVSFDDQSPEGIMAKHLHEKPSYLKDINVQLSHGVSKVVRKLMAKNKRDRYPTMSEVVKDLTLVRMGRSPTLGERSRYDDSQQRYRSATGSWRTQRPDRKKKRVQMSLCVGVALAMLLGGYLLFQLMHPSGDGDGAPGRRAGPPPKVVPAPRPAHQAFLEALLERRDKLPLVEFAEKLRDVADRYPRTRSAEKALHLAKEVDAQIDAEAGPFFEGIRSAVLTLRGQQRYQAALDKLAEFPEKYKGTRFDQDAAILREDIETAAQHAFQTLKGEARQLGGAGHFDEAIACYRVALDVYGLPAMAAEARAAIQRLEAAKAAEAERRAAVTAAAEPTKLHEARGKCGKLVREAKAGEAADALNALAATLTFPEDQAAVRCAARDLAALHALTERLFAADGPLIGKPVSATAGGGTQITGTVRAVKKPFIIIVTPEDQELPLELDPSLPYNVEVLTNLAYAGQVVPLADHWAIAGMYYFAGQDDQARARVDQLAADPAAREAAELRRKYFQLLSKDDEGP